tara:strand:+ start:515 stop:1798 length:1284 start_codon:yes stop_codon:yes gene_type:complete
VEKLEALSLALRQKAQGEADLMGLDEEYARASNLRDNTKSKINKYGTVSPLSLVADVINQSRGRKEMRELAPQRTAARTAISDNANALPLYQEQQNQAARELTAENLEFDRDTALTQATAKEKQRLEALRLTAANRGEDMALTAANRSEDMGIDAEEFEITNSDVVELVNVNDSTDVKQVRSFGGKYFDKNDKPVDSTGYMVKPKITRSSGSVGKIVKGKDAVGNEVIRIFNKSTLELSEPKFFADGTPYDEGRAKELGQITASQAGNETTAKDTSAANVKASEDAYAESFAIEGSIQELDKALAALQGDKNTAGANTGWFASKLPNVRAGAVKLQAANDQLALYEIGKYTFGSLSEAEGAWLKDVVLPTDLDEDELIPWVERKREGMRRMLKVKAFEQKMRDNGYKPTKDQIDQILYQGGFSFSDG